MLKKIWVDENICFLKIKQQLEENQWHLVLFIHFIFFSCVFCTSCFPSPGTEFPREVAQGRRDCLACSLRDAVHHGGEGMVALSQWQEWELAASHILVDQDTENRTRRRIQLEPQALMLPGAVFTS